MKKRKEEYKPLLFTTTLRNPERIKSFLKVINKYDGKTLTSMIINKIVEDLISTKEYIPEYVKTDSTLKEKIKTDDPFTKAETAIIIRNSPQRHKEAGFEWGWPSRFDTWYKFLKELGFVYYEMNKPIEVTEAGKMLIKANNEGYEHLEQQVFLSSFTKYQRDNPFRRISNHNKPLILLLKTILKLKESLGQDSSGINIKEIPLFICWKNDDETSLMKMILEIRHKYGFTPSNEYIYSLCKDILGLTDDDEKRFKISNICEEMPDDFIRKMRMTGLISIRGAGRFIDINNLELEKVKYIIDNYSDLKSFSSEKEYFDYVKTLDYTLINLQKSVSQDEQQKRTLFLKWVKQFEIETLKKELLILSSNHTQSKHELLKFIDGPLRFEFLAALILQKNFKNVLVKPNYSSDDEGIPTSFAPGNCADIICVEKEKNALFEVSLIKNKSQLVNEIIPIERHLQEYEVNNINKFSVFVAPKIHPDSSNYIEFKKTLKDINIVALDIPSFVNTIGDKDHITDFLN